MANEFLLFHGLATLFLNLASFLAALAEILSVKEVSSRKLYYVHYIDCEYCLIWMHLSHLEMMVVFTFVIHHFLCEKSTSAWMSGSQGTGWTWRSFSSPRKKLKHQPRMVFQAPVLALQKEKWYVCLAPPNVCLSNQWAASFNPRKDCSLYWILNTEQLSIISKWQELQFFWHSKLCHNIQ